MKTLLLIIIGWFIWGVGVFGCFLAGGAITTMFKTTDGGLGFFLIASIAWTIWLVRKMLTPSFRKALWG